MAFSVMVKVVSVVLMFIMVSAPNAEAALSCGTVITDMTPCLDYLRNTVTVASPQCCTGVKTLFNAATTTADRQDACKCMKSAATQVSGINLSNAASLPSKCGLNIPYKISPSTDCSKVQ